MQIFAPVFWSVAILLATTANNVDSHRTTLRSGDSRHSHLSESSDIRSDRPLRAGNVGDEDDEERVKLDIHNAKVAHYFNELKLLPTTEDILQWLPAEKMPSELAFAVKERFDYFSDPEIAPFINDLKRKQKHLLKDEYDREAFANLLVEAKKVTGGEDAAYFMQANHWRDNSQKYVERTLKDVVHGDDPSRFILLAWYYHALDLGDQAAAKLADKMGIRKVSEMLERFAKVPETEVLAEKLGWDLLWRSLEDPKGFEDFEKLFPLEEHTSFMKSAKLARLALFTDRFRPDYGDKKIPLQLALIRTLSNNLGERKLLTLLEASANVKGMKHVAASLERDALALWAVMGKTTDEVASLLSFERVKNLLQSWQYRVLVTFVHRNHKPAAETNAEIIRVLAKYCGDKELAKMIIEAQRVPTTKTLATSLEDDLVNLWHSRPEFPVEVSLLLPVDESTPLLESRQFDILTNYVRDFNRHAGHRYYDRHNLVKALIEHYGLEELCEILQKAQQVPDSKAKAEKLLRELDELNLGKREDK